MTPELKYFCSERREKRNPKESEKTRKELFLRELQSRCVLVSAVFKERKAVPRFDLPHTRVHVQLYSYTATLLYEFNCRERSDISHSLHGHSQR